MPLEQKCGCGISRLFRAFVSLQLGNWGFPWLKLTLLLYKGGFPVSICDTMPSSLSSPYGLEKAYFLGKEWQKAVPFVECLRSAGFLIGMTEYWLWGYAALM
jgi:hypothetical protein